MDESGRMEHQRSGSRSAGGVPQQHVPKSCSAQYLQLDPDFAKMTGINTDGAKYTFYPFSNFTSSPLLFHGTQYAYVKVTITNIAEHEVRYTTLQEVEVVSFWGTVEKRDALVLMPQQETGFR